MMLSEYVEGYSMLGDAAILSGVSLLVFLVGYLFFRYFIAGGHTGW